MHKRTLAKLGGFVAAATLTAGLVAYSAGATGAYFTDSHPGSINASTGLLKVTVSPENGALNFANLIPGEDQTVPVTYTSVTHSTQGEDIWLVFSPPTQDAHDNPSEAFTGRPDDSNTGGLGRFGHFKVTSDAGASFESYNLSSNRLHDDSAPCQTNIYGSGGDGSEGPFLSLDPTVLPPPYCSPVKPILLQSGLANGQSGTAQFTFGLTGRAAGPQNQSYVSVGYSIVATQHGIFPNNENNS